MEQNLPLEIRAPAVAVVIFLLVHVDGKDVLSISLYKVTHDGALIDWQFLPRQENPKELDYCEYVYGPVSDKELKQVSPDFIPGRHTLDLSLLDFNVTYYFHMICYDNRNNSFVSNTITFTTGSPHHEPINYLSSSSQRIPFPNIESPYPVSLDAERAHSSNVILGAVCGIVGFLIINVTIVLAIRKYSHWQMRRRRIIEMEDRDYDGFEYLEDME